ncbi:hypothetical protein [Aromatoleum buckelii]|uniref:Transposase n=1 Tax=Aromatoleum buckelii TaxID=200254 RepID=A0ABX1MVH0_9RHOO|nr:hypothetical protein [Aromatoleum buckelii]MCK0510573.1 hypothetical protein [Aromatoleum buckelii]
MATPLRRLSLLKADRCVSADNGTNGNVIAKRLGQRSRRRKYFTPLQQESI